MGQSSPAQTKPKRRQILEEVLKYVVGKGYSVNWYCDICRGTFCECRQRGIEFLIGNKIIDVIDSKGEYEVYINGHGPAHVKEVNDETLRQAANEIAKRLIEDVTF